MLWVLTWARDTWCFISQNLQLSRRRSFGKSGYQWLTERQFWKIQMLFRYWRYRSRFCPSQPLSSSLIPWRCLGGCNHRCERAVRFSARWMCPACTAARAWCLFVAQRVVAYFSTSFLCDYNNKNRGNHKWVITKSGLSTYRTRINSERHKRLKTCNQSQPSITSVRNMQYSVKQTTSDAIFGSRNQYIKERTMMQENQHPNKNSSELLSR